MGSSGYGFELTAAGQPAPRAEVHEAARQFLMRTWRARLPEQYVDAAIEWIDQGFDPLITLGNRDGELTDEEAAQPAADVIFVFYESCDWAEALAKHWFDLALIDHREDFEKELAKLGYTIASDYRTEPENEFIVEGDRIGHPADDGVFWQLPESEYTETSELEETTTKLIERVKTSGCMCSWCTTRNKKS